MYLLALHSCGLATGKARALARVGRAGENIAFLNILEINKFKRE
jgi:hypothetical protein